jgi:hypothetical protein
MTSHFKQVVLTKRPARLAIVKSGESDGFADDGVASTTEACCHYRSAAICSAQQFPGHSFFFLDDSRHPPTLHNTSLSNLVNSHFLNERWIDLHFLDKRLSFFGQPMWLARLFIANRPSAATAPAAAVREFSILTAKVR